MGWLQGAGLRRVKWVVVASGLLATGCAGALGAGAAAVVIGAGIISFTCYDRVTVTVTDRVTGTKLCDAKVTFLEGESETTAINCYETPLSAGKYTMRVERRGLQPFEQPVEVSEAGECGQSVQSMYVALDRLNERAAPTLTAAPAASAAVLPAPVAAPPPTATPEPGVTPAANPATSPPPASTAFPDPPP